MYTISTSRQLIKFLETVDKTTARYLKSDEVGYEELPHYDVEFIEDIHLDAKQSKKLSKLNTYFKGTIKGNGCIITSEASRLTALFTSIYNSKIQDLCIDTLSNYKLLVLAYDATKTEFSGIEISGSVRLTEYSGLIVNTSRRCTFTNCSVDADVTEPGQSIVNPKRLTMKRYFGGYVGSDMGSVFDSCKLSGTIVSEVYVGGFVSFGRDTTFINCEVDKLTIEADNHAAAFCAQAKGDIIIVNSKISNTVIKGKTYISFVLARGEFELGVDTITIVDSSIMPSSTLSLAGSIAGETKGLTIINSRLARVHIEANFLLAGLCPSLMTADIRGSEFSFEMVGKGYPPLKTCLYTLVRDDDPDLQILEENNNVNVIVTEAEGGNINPWEE